MSSYITRRAQAELLKLAFSTFINSIVDTLPPTNPNPYLSTADMPYNPGNPPYYGLSGFEGRENTPYNPLQPIKKLQPPTKTLVLALTTLSIRFSGCFTKENVYLSTLLIIFTAILCGIIFFMLIETLGVTYV
ncbi:hypothetical protein F5883DRAFT_516219 [Diaporthe sp. PMI_573]|nr:hypothetical protein F5883DRAFT_516219 [Diaporthaceae sp. PMI_573]